MRGSEKKSLVRKCANTEYFLVRIFLYSDQKKLRLPTVHTVTHTALMYVHHLLTVICHLLFVM